MFGYHIQSLTGLISPTGSPQFIIFPKMKNLLSFLFLFLAVGMTATAQTALPDRLSKSKAFKQEMENTMKQQRAKGEYYHVNMSKPNGTKVELEAYSKENDFHVVNIKTAEVKKFGDLASYVSSFDFLLKEDYENYNYEIACDKAASPRDGKKAMLYYWEKDDNSFHLQAVTWTGNVVNGKADGNGSAFFRKGELYCYVGGAFAAGVPSGKFTFHQYEWSKKDRIYRHSWHLGKFEGDMAKFWEDGRDNFGFLASNALDFKADKVSLNIKTQYRADTFISYFADNNGKFAVIKSGSEERKLGRNGEDLGLSDNQIAINNKKEADKRRAEAEKAAEEARQKAEAERLAAIKAEKIQANLNTKLWSIGCKLCWESSSGPVVGTLEEWTGDHSRAKVRILTSPNSYNTYKGESLRKNNLIWVTIKDKDWHLALDEEIEESIRHDNSEYVKSTVIYQESTPVDNSCPSCNGRGTVPCFECGGDGMAGGGLFSSPHRCTQCTTGYVRCIDCWGTGRRKR